MKKSSTGPSSEIPQSAQELKALLESALNVKVTIRHRPASGGGSIEIEFLDAQALKQFETLVEAMK